MSINFRASLYAGKSPAEVADLWALPGTPEHAFYTENATKDGESAFQEIIDEFFHAVLKSAKKHNPEARVLCGNKALVATARERFLERATIADYALTKEHVRRGIHHYSPYWILAESAKEGDEGLYWPTSWAFRLAQTKWKGSFWRMVPDFPREMLALCGFKLVTTSRWMGNDVLTGEERGEFCALQWKAENGGLDETREKPRIDELLGKMPYCGELPILDIDVAKIPEGEPEAEKTALERANFATDCALKVTTIWRQITGVTPTWTVSNNRGALHGLNHPLPPHVRHPDLLRGLKEEMKRLLSATDVPFIDAGDQSEKVGPVKLDLTTYNKYAAGKGGMWRVPGCAKVESGSIPQSPVTEHLNSMPWLAAVAPEAIGENRPMTPEALARILKLCTEHRTRIDEAALRRGEAYRDETTGEVKRLRKKAVVADVDLGTAEFQEVAKTLRELMPTGEHEGVKRHNVRLAVAGWLYKEKAPKEAALSTLLAAGRNDEDSRKAIDTTYARGSAGDSVMGIRRLEELLGTKGAQLLHDAFVADQEDREHARQLREESEPEPEEEKAKRSPLRKKDVEASEPEPEESSEEESAEDTNVEAPEGGTADETPPPPPPSIDDALTSLGGRAATSATPSKPSGPEAPSEPEAVKESAAGGVATAVKKTKTKVVEHNPEALTHPLTPQQLSLLEAKERVKNLWNAPHACTKLRLVLFKIHAKFGGTDWGKQFWVWKTIGRTFALAGLSRETVLKIVRGGLGDVLKYHKEALNDIRHYAPGKALPQFVSLKSIRSKLGWADYGEFIDALHEDLKDAPFDVKHRALVDQGRSSADRDKIVWTIACLEKSGRVRLPEFKKGEYARVLKSAKCTRIANVHQCDDHGDVSTRPVYCRSEVACPWCRADDHDTISAWIDSKWYHDDYVVLRRTASTEPVLVEVREEGEDYENKDVDEDPNLVAPERSDEHDRLFELFKQKKIQYQDLMDQIGFDKRFVLRWNAEKQVRVAAIKSPIRNEGRLERRKVLGKALSMDRLDQIKKGFSQTNDLKVLKQTTANKLGFRAFPTLDGVILVMPAIFTEILTDGDFYEHKMLDHLRKIGAFQDCNPRVVSKNELRSELIKARQEVGKEFDRLVHEFAIEASKAPAEPSPHDKDRDPGPAELAMLTFPFLRDRSMVPIKNKAAEEDLPWYSAETLKEFKKELREERYGPDVVKPGECPVPVLQPDGTTKPCRKLCCVKLENLRTKEIYAQNRTGKSYPPAEAFAIADEKGMNWGVEWGSRFGPPKELERANC